MRLAVHASCLGLQSEAKKVGMMLNHFRQQGVPSQSNCPAQMPRTSLLPIECRIVVITGQVRDVVVKVLHMPPQLASAPHKMKAVTSASKEKLPTSTLSASASISARVMVAQGSAAHSQKLAQQPARMSNPTPGLGYTPGGSGAQSLLCKHWACRQGSILWRLQSVTRRLLSLLRHLMNEAELATYYDDQKARGSAAHARKQGLGFVSDG